MSDGADVVGLAAEGMGAAVMARELSHYPDASGHDASGACANCGAVLDGPYCRQCGQHGHVHRTAGALVHDLLHGVFHFEGRFWATLPLLALRPGELTRRYAAGERVKFVSPMAMFLFSVFLLFAVVANLPGVSLFDMGATDAGVDVAKLGKEVSDQRLSAAKDLRDARRTLRREQMAAEPDAADIAEARREVAEAGESLRQLTAAQAALPRPEIERHEDGWLAAKVAHARENPQLLAYKVKSSAYKYSWALIPLSLPFIWLLFPFRRDVGLYDHAVFATYSLSFMSLGVVALASLAALGVSGGLLVLAALIGAPFHLYRQLKGSYRLSRAGALLRTVCMLVFSFLSLTAFTLLLLWMGTSH
jgi:hypothetical protein